MRKWHYRVTIFWGDETVAITNLTCKGTVSKGLVSSNNMANLEIYNLAPDTRSKIYQAPYEELPKRKLVRIEAGYNEDGSLNQIFFGQALQIYSQRTGGSTDVVTKIEAMCLDLFSQSSVTINKGASFKDTIKTLVNDLPNTVLGALGNVTGEFKTPTVFEGNTLEQINKIAGGGAFLDDGKLNVCLLTEVLDVPVPVFTNDNFLLETPVRKGMNLDVRAIMYPEILLGQLLEIQSGVWPDFNGQYKVIGFTHNFIFSETTAGQKTTTINLYICSGLPNSGQNISGNTGETNVCKVKNEEVQPVGNMTPASAIDVLRYIKNNNGAIPNTKITSQISWKELLGNDNQPQERLAEINIGILTNCYVTAQRIQTFCKKYFPGRAINISSGWRSTANNKRCGGVANSQHLYGKAIDFTVSGVSVAELGQKIKAFWDGGYQYTDPKHRFVHADIRNIKSVINDV